MVLENRSDTIQKDSVEIHDVKKKGPKFSNELLIRTERIAEIFQQSLLRPLRKCPVRAEKCLNGYFFVAIEL